jgi:hypothetical protein
MDPPSTPLTPVVIIQSGTNYPLPNRRHVLSDLRPYVCIIPSCSFSRAPFAQKKAWVHHLELEHGFADQSKNMSCPLCQENLKDGKTSHVARHLEEVSLTILPANAESDDESDASSEEESGEGVNVQSPGSRPATEHVPHLPDGHEPLNLAGSATLGLEWPEAVALFDFETNNTHELPLSQAKTVWISEASRISRGSNDDWVFAMSDDGGHQGTVPRSYLSLTGHVSTLTDITLQQPVNRADDRQPAHVDNFLTPVLDTADISGVTTADPASQTQQPNEKQAATEKVPVPDINTKPQEHLFCRPYKLFLSPGADQSGKMKEHRLTYGHQKRTGEGHQGTQDSLNSRWPCPICKRVFNQEDNLRAHVKKHSQQHSTEGLTSATTTPVASGMSQPLPGHVPGGWPIGCDTPSFVEGRSGEFPALYPDPPLFASSEAGNRYSWVHSFRPEEPVFSAAFSGCETSLLTSSEAENGDSWFPLFPEKESVFVSQPSEEDVEHEGRHKGASDRVKTTSKGDGVLPSHLDMARNEPVLFEETAEQDAARQPPESDPRQDEARHESASSPGKGGNKTRLICQRGCSSFDARTGGRPT